MYQSKSIITTAVILVLTQSSIVAATGPVCLTCDDVPNPVDCNSVAQCGIHEECSMEQFLSSTGHLRYKLGCKDSAYCGGVSMPGRTVLCSQCCDTNLCAASLCGAPGYPSIHGPICYHCEFPVRSVLDCDKIKVCGRDESCGVTGVATSKYEVKCRSAPECTIIRQNATCGDCCPDQLCNTQCASHGCDDASSCSGLQATFAASGQDICSIPNMRTLCNKTCGLCPNSNTQPPVVTTTTTTQRPVTTPVCTDDPQCPILVSSFQASGIDVCSAAAKYACNVTCSLCPGMSTPQPTTKPTTKPTTRPPPTSPTTKSTTTTTTTTPATTIAGTAPTTTECRDNIVNCAAQPTVCLPNNADWAYKNCKKFCNLCSGSHGTVTTNTSDCMDKLDNCAQVGSTICSDQNKDFAYENCKRYCNLCTGSVVSGNPCLSNPCRHGACVKYQTSYRCLCNEGYTGINCEIVNKIRDCKDVQDHHITSPNNDDVYVIDAHGAKLNVRCDMTTGGGGWTVLFSRGDNSVDFYKTSTDYAVGFGDVRGDYWMGLEDMHSMTADGRRYQLRIDILDANNTHLVQYYDDFSIGPRTDFTLSIGNTHGTAGDSLSGHSGFAFTTFDSDRDSNPGTNCAKYLVGGWWFHDCYDSCLTCPYLTPGTDECASFSWNTAGYCIALRSAQMLVRPM